MVILRNGSIVAVRLIRRWSPNFRNVEVAFAQRGHIVMAWEEVGYGALSVVCYRRCQKERTSLNHARCNNRLNII
jgi:hypothetical protein